MNIAEIFSMARLQAGGISASQITDAGLLPYANIVYKKIQNALIRKVNEKYFYDILTSDLVAGQNEYNLKNASGVVVGIKKVITTNIKTKETDTYFTKLDNSSTNLSKQAIDEQRDTPDQGSFVEVKDGSLFLFPAPTEDITGGLVVEAIVSLVDLTVTDEETDIFPYNSELRDYHELISLGIVPYIYSGLKLWNDYGPSKQIFEAELEKMCDELSDRYNNDLEGTLPNGNIFK